MKSLRKVMRTAVVAAASIALLIQPTFAGGSKSKSNGSRVLCEYCAFLPGVDYYGCLSEYECDGTWAEAQLKLNIKKCSIELCFSAKGKVKNYSCYKYCEYVDICDFAIYEKENCNDYCGEYGYDCYSILYCLDCVTYTVDAPKKKGHSYNYCVNAQLKGTGYIEYGYGG